MWLRLDDTLTDHPKFFGIDPRAGWLWVLGLCYAGRHALNGRIPKATALALATQVDRQETILEDEPEAIRHLVSRGLWERAEDVYMIHDFLDYNPSRREVISERKAARLRSRKARQARVSARVRSEEVRANSKGSSDPRPVLTRSHPVPKQIQTPPPTPPLGEPRRRVKNRSALQMAQDATTTALGEASARLVTAASERFSWTLTKTRLAEEWRLAGELLEHWDEATILRAIAQRRKLGSMRWLADFIPQMLHGELAAPPPKERAWLDDVDAPEPDLTPEQLAANQARIREMVTTALGTMPR